MSHRAGRGARGNVAVQLVAFVVSRGILLGSTVLVAKVAGVADFGAFALALVVYQAGLSLRDAGLGQALIVLGRDEQGLTWRAFTITSAAGLGLAVVMGALSGPLTHLLGVRDAAAQLQILAIAFGAGSLGVASNAALERDLRFRTRAAVDIASFGALGVSTVAGIALGLGAESLAIGYVAHGLIQSTLGIVLVPPWAFRGAGAPRLGGFLRYGGLLWASALLAYLATNLDNALVGRLGGATALGAYALSYTIGNTITISLAQVLNRVALPYYSRAVGNSAAVRYLLDSVPPLSVTAALVPSLLAIVLAPEIRNLLLTPDASLVPLVALSIYGVVRSLGMSLGTALNGTRRARVTTVGAVINVALMIVSIVPAFMLAGTAGVAMAVLGSMVVSTTYLARNLIGDGVSHRFLVWPAGALAGAALLVALPTDAAPLFVRLGFGGAIASFSALSAWTQLKDRFSLESAGRR